jgi:hypothetical protein
MLLTATHTKTTMELLLVDEVDNRKPGDWASFTCLILHDRKVALSARQVLFNRL